MMIVQGIGKCFRIHGRGTLGRQSYVSIREVLSERVRSFINPIANRSEVTSCKDFWALSDVTFSIKSGERIGIIGQNGAGKSTLLKLISRVTEPTTGRIAIKGRVASLLEVGTGFHPELTGRENIFLNGTILGMSRRDIVRKMDEIIEFAEVEEFLDTPVKRYSSGMYVRLAFSVAAHLEPDILIIDEVLAVGDAAFQKKCIGTMKRAASDGRTLLFVSHNMGTIGSLCSNVIYLKKGRVEYAGATSEGMNRYLADGTTGQGEVLWQDINDAPGNERVRIVAVRTLQEGQITSSIDMAKCVEVQIEYQVLFGGLCYGTSIHLLDQLGTCILATGNSPAATNGIDPWALRPMPPGRYCSSCFIPGNFLNDARYVLNAFVTDNAQIQAQSLEALAFDANDTGVMRDVYQGTWIGQIRPKMAWSTHPVDPTNLGQAL